MPSGECWKSPYRLLPRHMSRTMTKLHLSPIKSSAFDSGQEERGKGVLGLTVLLGVMVKITDHFGRACGIFIDENFLKKAANWGEPDANELAKGTDLFHRFAKVLEGHLHGRDCLVGDEPTLADFSVGSFLRLAEAALYPMEGYREIRRRYGFLEQLPCWQSATADRLSGR